MEEGPFRVPSVSCRELFLGFLVVGVRGFGGVMPWTRRMLVDERRWLDDRQFTQMLNLANPLPGANSLNLAVVVGNRFQGVRGAACALMGLLLAPICIVLTLASLVDRFGQTGPIKLLLPGVSVAAAGLVGGMGLRLIARMERGAWRYVLGAIAFLAVVWLHLSLVLVLLVLAPVGIGFARKEAAP
ncbi:MAG: chromate transporter [Holophaga sp.]|nr:chromate transporter [Holophaga sp.]